MEAGESDGERVLAWNWRSWGQRSDEPGGIRETGREKVAFAADGAKGAGSRKAGRQDRHAPGVFLGAFVINNNSFHL